MDLVITALTGAVGSYDTTVPTPVGLASEAALHVGDPICVHLQFCLNLCAFASLREIFSVRVYSRPFAVCLAFPMTRKSFLKRLSTLPILSALWPHLMRSAGGASPSPSPASRVLPSDPGWPDNAAWEKLNQAVGGRLIKVESPLAGYSTANDTAHANILKDLQNPFYIGDQPGATQTTGWVDAWMSAPSVYAIAAQTTDDVVAGVNFARTNNLRLVVKGGGHSYLGGSNAPDSLLISTRVMNKVVLLDAFVGQGCAGHQSSSTRRNHRIRRHVDHLFNPHWGETVSLRDNNEIAITMLFQGLAKSEVENLWNPFFDRIKKSPDKYTIASDPIILAVPTQKFWDAAFLKKYLPQAMHPDSRERAPEKYYWWDADNGQIGMYLYGYQSTWLPETLLAKDQTTKLVDALFSATRHFRATFHFNKGLAGAPPEEIAAARDTPMNPAVLDAFALVIIGGGGPAVYPGVPGHEPDLTEARQNAQKIGQAMAELRKIVPKPASYVNETNYFEESWQESFWGPNYARLKTIKEKYDPTGLFFVHHGVGSEAWTPDGFTRLKT